MRLDDSNSKLTTTQAADVEHSLDDVTARISANDSSGPNSQTPGTSSRNGIVIFSKFVRDYFLPEHIALKSTPGRRHYYAILKHVITPAEVEAMADSSEPSRLKLTADPNWPYLGHLALQQISSEQVQALVDAALLRGYSAQTVKHIRNVVRSVFAHAIRRGILTSENPAARVRVPESGRGELHVLTLAQTMELLGRMRYPEREVALMAILTSMTISEICGLQWRDVNLADQPFNREGLLIPPRHLAVRVQRYRGELAPVPPARRKLLPIPPLLHRVLRTLSRQSHPGWEDFVLTTRSGKPINQINLAVRALKRIGRQMDMPWISWQVFRRTRLSILHEYEVRVQDQLSRAIFPGILPIRPSQIEPTEAD